MVWLAEDPGNFWAEIGTSALHENNVYGQWYAQWGAWNGYVTETNTDTLRQTGRYPALRDKGIDMAGEDAGEGTL